MINVADFLLGVVTGGVIAFAVEAYRVWQGGRND